MTERKPISATLRQVITIVSAAVLTSILMTIIQPGDLKRRVRTLEDFETVHSTQAVTDRNSLMEHSSRIYALEQHLLELATKEDLEKVKQDLIRELKN